MVESTTTPPSKLGRLKLALIPVLVLILILVFVWPSADDVLPADNSETVRQGTQQSHRTDATTEGNAAGLSSVPMERTQKTWPAIRLASILKHDPFALAPLLANQTVAVVSQEEPQQNQETTGTSHQDEREEQIKRMKERIATLQQKQVSVVFRSESGTAAIIDSKIVHEGDLLEDGVRVVKIRSDGVVLQIQDQQFALWTDF